MSTLNYMQVLPFDEKRQRVIYKKCKKEELIEFLITRDKNDLITKSKLPKVIHSYTTSNNNQFINIRKL